MLRVPPGRAPSVGNWEDICCSGKWLSAVRKTSYAVGAVCRFDVGAYRESMRLRTQEEPERAWLDTRRFQICARRPAKLRLLEEIRGADSEDGIVRVVRIG